MKPNIVSNKNPLDYRVFLVIIGILISIQLFTSLILDDEGIVNVVSTISITNPLVAFVASLAVFKIYSKSMVFGRAYFALGIGFAMILLGEITYIVYDIILEEDPYPSIADVFFFSFNLLIIYHLRKNIKFFEAKFGIQTKISIWLVAIIIIFSYYYFAYNLIEEFNFDFFYSLVFVIISAITLSYALLGARSFKGGTLATAWLILVIGILTLTIGDTVYYYLELGDNYTLTHPVNLLWYGGYMIIVYGLYVHQKAI